MVVQLLIVDGDADASILLSYGNHRPSGVWGGGMSDKAGGQVLIDDGIRLFSKD